MIFVELNATKKSIVVCIKNSYPQVSTSFQAPRSKLAISFLWIKVKMNLSESMYSFNCLILFIDERVPADMVLVRTTEKSGSCFIRTDQLDGETDWKLRLAVTETQKLTFDTDLFQLDASVFAEKPQRDIHTFIGTFKKVLFVTY